MKVAVLAPICWRTPPRHYGPWEQIASNITEGLVARGIDVTLFASGDSITNAKLKYVCDRPYEEDISLDPKVWESLHISYLMEKAENYDIIHNNYDFLPLTYSLCTNTPMLTTIHGFSSEKIIPVYKKYNDTCYYVSISISDRSPELEYISTIYNGIKIEDFTLNEKQGDYLLFFGRIHHDKGTHESILIAKLFGLKLIISGIIQDHKYFKEKVKPFINGDDIQFVEHSGPERRDKLLGGAYALLHPVNFNEPFGLSVVESMLCGTPVVAFNRGSMPELIEDNKTGFLVNNVNEAAEVLSDVKNIDRKYCHTWSKQHFSQEIMVDNYIKVYKQILEGN